MIDPSTINSIIFLALMGFFYLLPTLVANARRGQQVLGVFILDLLLGWTFVGWVIALIWAVSMETKDTAGPHGAGSSQVFF
jgi:Superinfection immunity protein